MIIMSVDLGMTRTGLARCDEGENIATPVTVLTEKRINACAQKVATIGKRNNVEMYVVGLPKNMDNSEGESAERCRYFAKILKNVSKLPVEMWDERATTVLSYSYFDITQTYGKKRKNEIDAAAATMILDSFIEYRRRKLKGEDAVGKIE